MSELLQVLDDEQKLFRAVVMAEEDGIELLVSSGCVAVMIGWRHCDRVVSPLIWV
jgi:hypothetical protein